MYTGDPTQDVGAHLQLPAGRIASCCSDECTVDVLLRYWYHWSRTNRGLRDVLEMSAQGCQALHYIQSAERSSL